MNYFLAKTDPETYSIDDLEHDGKTTWDGVRNPAAVQALKKMQPGDLVLIYHSQGQKTLVGLAEMIGNSRSDASDSRSWLVDFTFVRKFTEPFVTLADIKNSGEFADFALVKQGRLSTMPVPEKFVSWLKKKGLKLSK